MGVDITTVKVRCDGNNRPNRGYKGCVCSPAKEVTIEVPGMRTYEWGRPLEENIGVLFKTYHHNLDDVYDDILDQTPPELEGWTFETDGIGCDWTRCKLCSELAEDED